MQGKRLTRFRAGRRSLGSRSSIGCSYKDITNSGDLVLCTPHTPGIRWLVFGHTIGGARSSLYVVQVRELWSGMSDEFPGLVSLI